MVSCNPEEDPPTFVYDGDAEELSLLGSAEDSGGIDKIVVDEFRLRGFIIVRHAYPRMQQRLLRESAAFFALDDEEKAGIAGGAGMRKIKGRPVGVLGFAMVTASSAAARPLSQIVSLDDCEAPQTESSRGLIPSGFDSTRLRVPVLGHVSSAAGIVIASAGRGKASSLEILSPGGNEWRAIDELIADDSSLVVFPGDYMAIISKEVVPAAVHRSTAGSSREDRISVPVLFRTRKGAHWPDRMKGMLDCEEPLAMDDMEAYCSLKRKRQAAEHLDEGDNWILSTRDVGVMADTNLGEVAEPLSFGMISGFCSGFFLKKVGKAAAVTFGVVFVTFQAAAQAGYVNVNWDAVQRDVMKGLDMDGDGEVTEMDAREAVVRAVNYLYGEYRIAAGSFMAGFVLGVRKG
ncbi:hypothetical protein FOZ60_007173 [Perkinsus olseni]|uniref:EF-hand domain-containing protein n=2 Tax=Perkinsus olseni TaxID=32597 RepID=A0A7J6NM35_PEROL|nr:hypothetical protein FOZ60_007173 [Perkinsus olseni]